MIKRNTLRTACRPDLLAALPPPRYDPRVSHSEKAHTRESG
jgi:hypothetical protein